MSHVYVRPRFTLKSSSILLSWVSNFQVFIISEEDIKMGSFIFYFLLFGLCRRCSNYKYVYKSTGKNVLTNFRSGHTWKLRPLVTLLISTGFVLDKYVSKIVIRRFFISCVLLKVQETALHMIVYFSMD